MNTEPSPSFSNKYMCMRSAPLTTSYNKPIISLNPVFMLKFQNGVSRLVKHKSQHEAEVIRISLFKVFSFCLNLSKEVQIRTR